jgi:hypothetical protein
MMMVKVDSKEREKKQKKFAGVNVKVVNHNNKTKNNTKNK